MHLCRCTVVGLLILSPFGGGRPNSYVTIPRHYCDSLLINTPSIMSVNQDQKWHSSIPTLDGQNAASPSLETNLLPRSTKGVHQSSEFANRFHIKSMLIFYFSPYIYFLKRSVINASKELKPVGSTMLSIPVQESIQLFPLTFQLYKEVYAPAKR